jgi:hypothetical protein
MESSAAKASPWFREGAFELQDAKINKANKKFLNLVLDISKFHEIKLN